MNKNINCEIKKRIILCAGNPLVCDCAVSWIVTGGVESGNSTIPYADIITGAECTNLDGNLEDLTESDFADC